MNIGLVSQALPYLPSKGGFRLYGANLIRCLSGRHRIDLVSLLLDDDADHLEWARRHCASVTTVPATNAGVWLRAASVVASYLWGVPARYRAEIAAILRAGLHTHRWDVLHVEGPFAAGLVPADLPLPKVLSAHDSWTLRCDEMLKCAHGLRDRLYYRLLKYHEPRYARLVYPRFERCVVVAERDHDAVQRTVPDARVVVIPYGVDVDHFRPLSVAKDGATVAFHGHLGYAPNVAAALELSESILPLVRRQVPGVTLELVAADPVREIRALAARPDIRLTVNPPDVRIPLATASVYASAVRHGTGMKNKILEAMALRLPVVCYPESTSGIDCRPGVHLLVARHREEFVEHVTDLLRNPQRADRIAAAGRDLMESQYSWDRRAGQFEELYSELLAQRVTQGALARAPKDLDTRTSRSRS